MDLYDAIYGRKSVRHFDTAQEIPQELVIKLLEAACQAPSAGNLEPWRFVVVKDKGLKEKLVAAAVGQGSIAEAPIVIVVCIDLHVAAGGYRSRGRDLYAIQDTAAATENLLLAAYAEGLGSCWVGSFNEKSAARALSLASHIRPVAMVALGHPRSDRHKPTRRDVSEVTSFL